MGLFQPYWMYFNTASVFHMGVCVYVRASCNNASEIMPNAIQISLNLCSFKLL